MVNTCTPTLALPLQGGGNKIPLSLREGVRGRVKIYRDKN